MKGWMLSLEVMEEFFVRVGQLKEDTRENRERIMNDLIHEYDVKILKDDKAIKDVLVDKKVLHIKREKSNGNNTRLPGMDHDRS